MEMLSMYTHLYFVTMSPLKKLYFKKLWSITVGHLIEPS
jgi:hypothetical protein